MTDKTYLMFQQSELDGAEMYRQLTDLADSDEEKEILHSLRADEGAHAGALSGITGRKDLRPTQAMAKPVLAIGRNLGKTAMYLAMGLGEHAAYYLYQPLAAKRPQLKRIARDERRHGEILLAMAKKTAAEGTWKRLIPLDAAK